MQNLTVIEIRGPLGKGKQHFYAIKAKEIKVEPTTFDAKITDVRPGSVIGVELELNGEYTNITEWNLISEPAAVATGPAGGIDPVLSAARLELDARAAALNTAGHLAGAKVIELKELLPQAGEFYRWLRQLDPGAVPAGDKRPTSADDDFDQLKSAGSASKESHREAIAGSDFDGHFKNVGELFTRAAKDGVTRAAILTHCNLKEADVPKINPDDLWPDIYEKLVLQARKLKAESTNKN